MNTNQNEENKPSQRGLKIGIFNLLPLLEQLVRDYSSVPENRFTSPAHQLFLFI